MAIYHLSTSVGSRGGGQSAAAKDDYIQREGRYDGDPFEVEHAESGHMPEWAEGDPHAYWEAADLHERANGRLFREVMFALPAELTGPDRVEAAREFAQFLTEGERLPYTLAIHRGGKENPHCHLVISERSNDGVERGAAGWFKRYNAKVPGQGGARKCSTSSREWLKSTREAWAEHANRALERAGSGERVDHRTLAAQREAALERGDVEAAAKLDREPGVHLGPARALELKGRRTELGERARAVERRNHRLGELRQEVKGLEQKITRMRESVTEQGRSAWSWLGRRQAEARDWLEEHHRKVAGRIIEQIKRGLASWQRPWKPGEKFLPVNLATGRHYSGFNSLHLAAVARDRGYSDTRWGTRQEVEEGGGRIREGEQGTEVLSGGVEGEVSRHTVFNAEQADGLPSPPSRFPEPDWKAHLRADNLIRASGVSIDHRNAGQVYYSLERDRIVLPPPRQFVAPEHYYQTAVHEMGHATGHRGRLDRESLQQGVAAGYDSEAYGKEELRAEISASLTGERIGVGHNPSGGEDYAESWVKVLEKDPADLARAAEEAQQISDYLMDRARKRAAKEQRRSASPEAGSRKPSPIRQQTPLRTPEQPPSQDQDQDQDHGPSR